MVTACHGIVQDVVATQSELLEDDRLVRETTEMMLQYLQPTDTESS